MKMRSALYSAGGSWAYWTRMLFIGEDGSAERWRAAVSSVAVLLAALVAARNAVSVGTVWTPALQERGEVAVLDLGNAGHDRNQFQRVAVVRVGAHPL